MRSPRQRWLTIGSVLPRWYVLIGNSGFPNGLMMHWKGHVDLFQPCEFLEWAQLIAVIEYRLALAGLEMMALASRCVRDGRWIELRALVRRGKKLRK